MNRLYLDYAATAPLSESARAAMVPWLDAGNASSLHADGRRAKAAIDQAREILAARLGRLFAEVIFTSGGSEAANLAIVGVALANRDASRRRIVLGVAEHHCVLHTRGMLERLGYQVDLAPVDRSARVDLDRLGSVVGPDVLLVSVMHANNELGTLQPIEAVSVAAHRVGAMFHCDAVQTLGPFLAGQVLNPTEVADLVSFSGHKIGGPKGVGALFVAAGTKVAPVVVGGGQERELRAGTENVAAIVGFGGAIEGSTPIDPAPRDRFLARLGEAGFAPTVRDFAGVLPGHAHVRFPRVNAETLLIRLDLQGISASSGAACSSGSIEPSHVLLACGFTLEEAREGVRFTFGPDHSLEDANLAAERVIDAVAAIGKVRSRP